MNASKVESASCIELIKSKYDSGGEPMQSTPETESIRQIHMLAKQLTTSDIPVVHTLAIQLLGISKLLVSELLPEEFEHVSVFEIPRKGIES